MSPDALPVRLEVVPQRCQRIDVQSRDDLVRLEKADAPDLHGSHSKESHVAGDRSDSPRPGYDQRNEEKRAEYLPAGPAKALARDHFSRFSRRSRSSGPVRVMSPAPIVMTTSPSRTNPVSAAARSERSPCHVGGRPARSIAAATRSEVIPGIGCSRAGYISARKTLSAPANACPNASEKSRVRVKRCGWNAATIRRPGYDERAAWSVAAISVG